MNNTVLAGTDEHDEAVAADVNGIADVAGTADVDGTADVAGAADAADTATVADVGESQVVVSFADDVPGRGHGHRWLLSVISSCAAVMVLQVIVGVGIYVAVGSAASRTADATSGTLQRAVDVGEARMMQNVGQWFAETAMVH